MTAKGLDDDGFIVREGSLSRVQEAFAAVVDAAREQITKTFGTTRLHGAYLYGSIPRGTAIPSVSDLDLLLALHREPTEADRSDADALETALDTSFAPTPMLARETNGDLDLVLPTWRERAATITSDAERRKLSRTVARRIVRTGFTLVMPRWGGWTSDLTHSAEIFGDHYPERAAQMRLAAATARTPTPDPATLTMLIDELAPWLAAEYTKVHGQKAPRP